MWSEKWTLALACFIPIYFNLFHTIFGCSRSVWTIHHLQDGLQRCCLMLLHLFARFGDLVKAYLEVTVCMHFCSLSGISPITFFFWRQGAIDNPWQPLVSSDVIRKMFALACLIPIYFNLFHTIFGCSRSVWIIHHLQDGLQRCCLMLLHLFARFCDLVKVYLKVTVCMRFCRLSGISTASNYIFLIWRQGAIDNPWQPLVSSDVIRKMYSCTSLFNPDLF